MKKYTFFFIVVFMALVPKFMKAQGFVESLVEEVVKDAVVGEFKSALWGGFLDSQARSKVLEKAKGLSDYPIDDKSMKEIETELGRYNLNGYYDKVYYELYSHVDKSFNSTKQVRFSSLGGGAVGATLKADGSTLSESVKYKALSEILSQSVMDSLATFKDAKGLGEKLLVDINYDEALARIINNHPELLRTYGQLANTGLRNQVDELVYWGLTLKLFNALQPDKIRKKLIDPSLLSFVEEYGTAMIMSEDLMVGSIKNDVITCRGLDLMNTVSIPNKTYVFNNCSFKTDALGRVVQVKQTISLGDKRKNQEKGKIKSKAFETLKSDDDLKMLIHPALLEYGAPDCYMNLAYFKKTDENREMLKKLKRDLKELSKEGVYSEQMVTTLEYMNGGECCSQMTVQIGKKTPCVFMNP